jgi:hypothetical protein
VIDIGGQGLGDEIVIDLIHQLRNSCVVELSLSNNKLTDETLIRLSTILPSLSQLSSLNVSANQIRDTGIKAIFTVDIFPCSLKHLDLSRNMLGPVSAHHIGSAFVQSKKILKTDKKRSNSNDFRDLDGLEAKNVPQIERLLLGGNQVVGSSTEFNRILMSFLCQNCARVGGLQSLSLPRYEHTYLNIYINKYIYIYIYIHIYPGLV